MFIKIVTSLFVVLFVGCGGTPKAPQRVVPLSHEVTFVESSSSAEIMVRAKGIGETIAQANEDAKKAALWFLLYGGDNPLLQTSQEKSAFATIEKEMYAKVAKYIVYDSGIKSKQKNANIYAIEHLLRLNVAMLREDLIAQNILKATEELLEGIALPTIGVIAKSADAKVGVNVVSEYLHDENFEVVRLEHGGVDKIFLSVAKSISVDPLAAEMYASALSSGSDIYISVNVDLSSRKIASKEVKKASVSLRAYYTANAKEIGSITGYSQERVVSSFASLIAEASNDAANKLLGQIQKSWKKEAQNGKYYKLIVTTPPEMLRDVDRALYKALKKTCSKVKPNKSIHNIFDYTLQCKEVANFKELEMQIVENYAGAGEIFTQAAKGAFLVLKIANSESDEIEIE